MALQTLQNFYKATVSTAWATGTGNRYVSVLPTVSSGRLVVNPSDISKREIVSYSATGTDAGGTYVTLSARGVGGTTDQTHDVNEAVRMNLTAQHYSDIQTELDLKLDDSQLDTDGTLAANSDTKIASQKATKTYAMPLTYLDTDGTFAANSDTKVATQKATKTYADALAIAGAPDASTTIKGIVEEATQAEIEAQTAAGGTAARLFMNPSTWFSAFKNMFTVVETTSSPYSLTTTAGQRVIVFARGVAPTGGAADVTYNLTYNGVSKDSVTVRPRDGSGKDVCSLMYTEIPGAATADVVLTGSLPDTKMIIIKF